MHDWQSWLADISSRTLPGGVAVAAKAAAMGAALAAKAVRVTLARDSLPPAEQAALRAAGDKAREVQAALLRLSAADEDAFRRVLAAGKDESSAQERREAMWAAVDVPLQVAGTCRDLLDRLSPLRSSFLPAVLVDLDIGTRLLIAGMDAGVRAARANVEDWKRDLAPDLASGELVQRLKALAREKP